MSTTRVILLRHGQTYGNVDGLFCGHSETALTPLGIAQARAAGRSLGETEFDGVLASDLSRASDMARYALEERPTLTHSHDPRLREMHYGEWETRPVRDISKEHPEALRAFFGGDAAPGGETVLQLRARMREAVNDAVDSHRGGTVLLVSHGNAIMGMLAEFLQLPPEMTWAFACDNTSITRVQFSKSGRFTLLGFNDAHHTAGLGEG